MKDQEEGRPTTKSPINLDSNFHPNFELGAVAIKNEKYGSKILTDVQFCDTPQARRMFEGFSHGRDETPLAALLKILEVKLSRTDTALNFHKSSRMDKFPEASKSGKSQIAYQLPPLYFYKIAKK